MADPLLTYLQDHLSGAKFALTLLDDLAKQDVDSGVAELSKRLQIAIEEDRAALESCVKKLGGEPSALKEAAAWIAQKAGKAKLSTAALLGVFEAVELLVIGVTGKKALWKVLAEIDRSDLPLTPMELNELMRRADEQAALLEETRLRLGKDALSEPA